MVGNNAVHLVVALQLGAEAIEAVRLHQNQGRSFVTPDDVKRMVLPVLAHRVILRPESRLRRQTAPALLHELVSEVRVPSVPGQEARDAFAD